jgi:uncharacterized membrane protein HdeD (DUF308 family)
MSLSIRFDDQHLPAFGKNWGRFLLWGIVLVILGVVAICASTIATLISVVALGFLIFFAGAVILIDTLTFWWGKWGGFFLHLLAAILYLIVGAILIMNPIEGSISLTLLLGAFYVVIGLYRIFYSTTAQLPRWGWSLFNGIISLLLGILILASWPSSALFIIGLFVGIDLVFAGWTYIMAALAARTITHRLS